MAYYTDRVTRVIDGDTFARAGNTLREPQTVSWM